MNSGEAFIKAVSDRTGHNFGNVKIAFDVGCVALAAGLSLLLFRGQIIGVREGTVISALLTGLVVEYFVRRLSRPLTAVLTAQENINKASGRAGGFVYILTFLFRLGQDHQLAVLLINGIVRLGRDAGVLHRPAGRQQQAKPQQQADSVLSHVAASFVVGYRWF